jgi:hypothetical protein
MRSAIVAFALLAGFGCNQNSVAPVSGRVTLDGQPLAGVFVIFEPIQSGANPGMGSIGKTDAEGRYAMRQMQPDRPGALVGKHRVRITTAPLAKSTDARPSSERQPKTLFTSPADDPCVVPPGGTNQLDFHLSSKSH